MVDSSKNWKEIISNPKKYDNLHLMRYMGTKSYLLDFIIPTIRKLVKNGETILDLMAGTHSIGYALKKQYRILANDIQEYSFTIGKAIIENNSVNISKNIAITKLQATFNENMIKKSYKLFYETYADTYFSKNQCLEIDSIRYAIESIKEEYEKSLYLSALIYAMCYAQSTTGHFAQFLPMEHKRLIPLRKISVWDTFLDKCDDIRIIFSDFKNKVFNEDYKVLFNKEFEDIIKDVSLIYLDPPYTDAQYSRFYHILETMIRYDYPKVNFVGRYRNDRFMSGFCSKVKAPKEFEFIIKKVSELNKILVISYSNKGIVTKETIVTIAKRYFKDVKFYNINYSHSKQGKGNSSVNEILFVCKN